MDPVYIKGKEADDLDLAEALIEETNMAVDYEQGSAFALKAIAHTLLWNAKQHREMLRIQAAAARAAEEWRKAQPPPPPPMPIHPYQGF
jgi:hypothetical protein